jgi:hypothetical protein
MQSNFEATRRLKGDRYLTRLRQRAEALHQIETTGEYPGVVPWPLTMEVVGKGPDPRLCSQCDLYVDCPILDRLQSKVSLSLKKAAGT